MRLVLRCDGSATVGYGHVLRCVGLAQAASRRGHQIEFATLEAPAVRAIVERHGFRVRHADGECAWATGAQWAVLDGYHFDQALARALEGIGTRVCLMDDLDAGLSVPLAINPNLHAREIRRSPATRRLFGPLFAPLREDFAWARLARERRAPPATRRVLLTFGGSDVAGLTRRALEALAPRDDLELTEILAVVGWSNPAAAEVEAQVARSRGRARLVRTTDEMARLMAESDLAISAAGTTALELLCVGVPAILYSVAANQADVAPAAARAGACLDMGSVESFDPQRLVDAVRRALEPQTARKLSAAGRALVDGRGAQRVIEEMER